MRQGTEGMNTLFELKIYNPQMQLKRIISREEVTKIHWANQDFVDIAANNRQKAANKRNAKKRKKTAIELTCDVCKKKFQGRPTRKFCHNPCKFKDPRSEPPKKRPCRTCHDYFTPEHGGTQFCYDPCTFKEWRKKQDKLDHVPMILKRRPCKDCKKLFKPKHASIKFCNKPCTAEEWRNKERKRKNAT